MTFNFQTTQENKEAAVAAAKDAIEQQTAGLPQYDGAVRNLLKNHVADAVMVLGDDPARDVYVAASGFAAADDIGPTMVNVSMQAVRVERVRATEPANVTVEPATDVGGQLAAAIEGAAPEVAAAVGGAQQVPDTTGHE